MVQPGSPIEWVCIAIIGVLVFYWVRALRADLTQNRDTDVDAPTEAPRVSRLALFWPAFQARKRAWLLRNARGSLGPPCMWIERAYIQVNMTSRQTVGATVELGMSSPIEIDPRDLVIGFLPFSPSVKSVWTTDAGFNGSVLLDGRTIKVRPGTSLAANFDAIGEEVRNMGGVGIAVKWRGALLRNEGLRFEKG